MLLVFHIDLFHLPSQLGEISFWVALYNSTFIVKISSETIVGLVKYILAINYFP